MLFPATQAALLLDRLGVAPPYSRFCILRGKVWLFIYLRSVFLILFKIFFFCLGDYDINESLVKQSPTTLVSCFKSKTDRGLKLTSIVPGPGYYNPHDHIKIPKKTLIP